MTQTISRATLRSIVRTDMEAQEASRYRITRDNELHYYGRMPNSIVTGWWLVSQDVDAYVAQIVRESTPDAFA